MKRLPAFAAGLVLFGAVGVYALTPGYHRVLTPALFGASKVAPGIFLDAPEQRDAVLALLSRAQRTSAAFFGTPPRQPRLIVCTTAICAQRFGLRVRGVALGMRTMLLAPGGVNATILTHEQVHIDLRQRMGLWDVAYPRYPAWFDEGLASLLSQDARLDVFAPKDAAWIMAAQGRRDWSRLNATGDWRRSYGAALSLVEDIDTRLGRDGLRALITEVAETGDFDAAKAARLGPDWP